MPLHSLLKTSYVTATCLHVSNKRLKEYIQSQTKQIKSISKITNFLNIIYSLQFHSTWRSSQGIKTQKHSLQIRNWKKARSMTIQAASKITKSYTRIMNVAVCCEVIYLSWTLSNVCVIDMKIRMVSTQTCNYGVKMTTFPVWMLNRRWSHFILIARDQN